MILSRLTDAVSRQTHDGVAAAVEHVRERTDELAEQASEVLDVWRLAGAVTVAVLVVILAREVSRSLRDAIDALVPALHR